MAEIIFPLDAHKVKWESSITQSWSVEEQTSASGKRRALTYQSLPAWQFDIEFPALSLAERDTLLAFYSRVQGSLIPFYYKDTESYKAENLQLPKNTDGSYQLVANMHGQQEPVMYADLLKVYVDGVLQDTSAYKLDRGAIVFTTAPTGKVTASYEYYWRVCFATSALAIDQVFKDVFDVSLSLKVVR